MCWRGCRPAGWWYWVSPVRARTMLMVRLVLDLLGYSQGKHKPAMS
jgi:hypothetical protein